MGAVQLCRAGILSFVRLCLLRARKEVLRPLTGMRILRLLHEPVGRAVAGLVLGFVAFALGWRKVRAPWEHGGG